MTLDSLEATRSESSNVTPNTDKTPINDVHNYSLVVK